jgi:hypothetical protein
MEVRDSLVTHVNGQRRTLRWTVVRFRATIKRALENQKSSFSTIHNAAISCLNQVSR